MELVDGCWLLEVPHSQHHMERGCDPPLSAEPLAPQGSSMEKESFVKCGGTEVLMTNLLAHANSGEVNEIFTQVLEGMGSNKIGEKNNTVAKPAASSTGGARQRKKQNSAGNAAAHKHPSSNEVKLWSKFPLSLKHKVNIGGLLNTRAAWIGTEQKRSKDPAKCI